ncbi:VacJ family lipoprotein [Novosphingobium mangrovi (ex Huang et al. 2023)]|uniref:VacJ family lipoprotein n=1 Tax=Novosphingobium mangrovi (ex Huang et al. 2023) TaxID=2976432 RepID=A0ABT2I6G5_9SPHN|nr:VacJ family lipoprotein [Novosphingobium mangrovi (ex Huang et al. 2023)]MCT2400391.1 VacJ family lipoprotein [Novosphingobium mangrovi (ex Huang et al. 2023)]
MSVSMLALPVLLASAPVEAGDLPSTLPPIAAAQTSQEANPPSPADEATTAEQEQATGQQDAQSSAENAPADNTIIVTHRAASPADPVEAFNVVSYEAVQALDKAIVGPIARTYKRTLPEPIQDGVHNVLDNLDEPIVFVNFLLQLKPGKAIETLGRFVINTTLGLGGLFDVAKKKPFNLPRRSNGLADTLGYYGVGPGPYMFLPIIGATTLRDLLARPFDLAILPAIAPKPFARPEVALGKGVLSAVDERAQNDDKLTGFQESADPYVAQREEYLARRRAEIDVLKGRRKTVDGPLIESEDAPAAEPEAAPLQEAPADPAAMPETTGTP